VGLLAILKAGAAYVPLEPNYPLERMSFIIDDSRAGLVLTQKSLLASLPSSSALLVSIDDIQAELDGESSEDFENGATVDNAAHVIYTSGSTGRPKGVVSSHAASLNRFAWMWRQYPFAPAEVCCQKTSLSFVDSIWEIFGPLLHGVPLVIIPNDVVKDPPRFVAALSTHEVTRLVLVPSLLRAIIEDMDDLAQQLTNLRYCVCSGETLPSQLAAAFKAKLPQTTLINLYGSSEVAADVTCYEVASAEGLTNIPIGRPIANTQVYVLDTNLNPVAVGVPGEIFVGGIGLAHGYLARPELTAEKFVPDPFRMGARLFRTGDLGRYLADGNIEYRGRRDHQVKVRGFRIELGEIEAALATHPQVREAVAVARDDSHGDKRLVAYVVAGEPEIGDLRAHLRAKLPEYMIPGAFVMLSELPLTPSGKLDRLALPSPDYTASANDFVAPRTITEMMLAKIWAEELGLERVGRNDDFFSLGGHSLLLTRIGWHIRKELDIELPLRTLFEASTVGELAEKIDNLGRTESVRELLLSHKELPISTRREGEPQLSFAQERLWFFDQLEPGSAAYNIPRAFRLKGTLNKEALQQSLTPIFARHEVLRTTFRSEDGKPVLSIAESGTPEVSNFNLSQLPPGEREAQTRALITYETEQPFDLARGPLLRLALIKLETEEHVLVLTMHHIISDGWSIGNLLRELLYHYNGILTEKHYSLPELSVQYADFAAWQREHLHGLRLANELEFWRQQLDGAPAMLNLPLDRPRAAARSFRGARRPLTIPVEIAAGLRRFARSESVTLYMVLLAGFEFLLSCVSGDEDIVVGSPIAGRNRQETEELIGYFVNTLVLRTKLTGDPSFQVAVQRVRETTLNVFGHQDVPFEKLVDELSPRRSLEFNPLFQVWFVLQNVPFEEPHWSGLKVESIDIDSSTTRHDLQLTLWETEGGVEGAFTYASDLFDEETIDCMSEQFTSLLQFVVEDPDIRLSVLRERIDEVGRAYRERVTKSLENASHQKLRSAKRKAVSDQNQEDLNR
jgi:amino acid adenylation domain-containing protein